jgi:hypothetical protein
MDSINFPRLHIKPRWTGSTVHAFNLGALLTSYSIRNTFVFCLGKKFLINFAESHVSHTENELFHLVLFMFDYQ